MFDFYMYFFLRGEMFSLVSNGLVGCEIGASLLYSMGTRIGRRGIDKKERCL